ncbi:hypothetical protein EVAR_25710_1 [Eumeta japonica]|uniref:Pre-C2HC domain-containing protein n=1 Tax=Eumeta variegata TaxID=151549 RepID=A0A4C1YU22_EUMVA|nr:hypothetical protein EVAR_25710_1 [Eumeta japonica]
MLKVAYHTYSLKEDHEFRVVLRGVLVEEVKEDLIMQNLSVQSVWRITNCTREPLDFVLVTTNTSTNNATKRMFYNIKALCSFTQIEMEQPYKKSIPRQCFDCQLYGYSSKNCYQVPGSRHYSVHSQ